MWPNDRYPEIVQNGVHRAIITHRYLPPLKGGRRVTNGVFVTGNDKVTMGNEGNEWRFCEQNG